MTCDDAIRVMLLMHTVYSQISVRVNAGLLTIERVNYQHLRDEASQRSGRATVTFSDCSQSPRYLNLHFP